MPPANRAEVFLSLFARAGYPMAPAARVLDFGCGRGALVHSLAKAGFDAYGCDFDFELGEPSDAIRVLPMDPYQVPFDDAMFDCVLSDQVFEHVQNYQMALREIRRVLKPAGVSLNLFPARYRLREPHVLIPFATVLQSRWWLALWAYAGVRNGFQQDKGAREVTALNWTFLRAHTTYFKRRRVLREARAVFPDARLLEAEMLALRPGRRARLLSRMARHLPLLATVWCETRARGLLLLR